MPDDIRAESLRIQHSTNLLNGSSHEYLGARCLELNHFSWVAMPLYAMAIEKILKAIICEKDQSLSPRSLSHNFTKLFNQVNQFKDYDLTRFASFIPKLDKLFSVRYHDNPMSPLTMEQRDYDMIDDLYIELTDQIKIIPEIKVRCSLLTIIFDKNDDYRPIKQWALKNNKALAKKLSNWQKVYDLYWEQ